MLTRKILSSTAALAMTASIALLAGCPTPGGTPTPTETPAEVVSATPTAAAATPTAAAATPTAVATPVSTATAPGATATPQSPTGSSNPVGQTGGTSDIKERATFNGKVYDENGIVVDGAKVTAKSVDANVSWVGEEQTTTNGAYVFRNAPVGARVEVTVIKENWTTRVRTEVLKSNLQGDPTANVFDFGGLGGNGQDATSSFYDIQDEPEVISLKINGKQTISSGGFPSVRDAGADGNNGRFGIANDSPGIDGIDSSTELQTGKNDANANIQTSVSGLDNDKLDIEMIFSEPVDRESVTNNFQVISQNFDVLQDDNFVVDETLDGITFTWSADDKQVLIKTNKAMLTTTGNPEARYLLNFTTPFKDKANNQALNINAGNVSPTGHFRYSPGTNNDFNVFSLKIDDQDPQLLSISAQDGSGANDIIRLTFNEALEVINHNSLALALADPTDAGNANPSSDRQLWAFNTNNPDADGTGGTFLDSTNYAANTDANQATVLGYTEGSNSIDDFKAVYMIARLKAANQFDTGETPITTALAQNTGVGQDGDNPNCFPARGNPSTNIGNNSLLRFASIDGNQVTLEFAQEAFSRNERIIVSIGDQISTKYTDSNKAITRRPINVPAKDCDEVEQVFSTDITDPAGNNIATGNSTTSGSFEVDDSLRVGTAG